MATSIIEILPFTSTLEACIRNCKECERACNALIARCRVLGGRHVEPSHIALLLDCATACRTAAELMERGSDLSPAFGRLCVEACRRCAQSCQAMLDTEQLS